MQIYQNHFTLYKQTASRLHQDTLYRFMIEGWQSHLNKMRTLYRKKHEILISSIKKHLGDNVKVIGGKSGLHIVLEVNNGMTEGTLISNASKASVKVYPLSIYYDGENNEKSEVILGFGGLTLSEIEEGIGLLKEAWDI
ncbi:hypothetical protein DFO73_10686 [Cytobacillus oceanisediminis]|uniref:GntR family transcriptional regulator/MocR family aminotransferase n=1 Tax=Cytobacillus oceanisediminis TaxID=665099 RepID=A0A2V2ZV20_9BACI|nr:hypothetical protein DFO73_10686 [Cytobacillus oceanisediminis]